MSRRGKTIVKRVVLDPKFNSELVAHMIRVIMKDGKKTVAEKIVYGMIDKVKEALAADPEKFKKDDKQFKLHLKFPTGHGSDDNEELSTSDQFKEQLIDNLFRLGE